MYSLSYKIKSSDVDYYQRLKVSTLLKMIQEVSIAHTEKLHMGRDKTLDKGFLWIITREQFHINRLPHYDEEIIIVTYPGRTMHGLFPRYYQILDSKGNIMIFGSALWTLINIQDRKIIDPSQFGIKIREDKKNPYFDLPGLIKNHDLLLQKKEKVTFSFLDLNHHMNNNMYADWIMNLAYANLEDREISFFQINFLKESLFNDTIKIEYSLDQKNLIAIGYKNKDRRFEAKVIFK